MCVIIHKPKGSKITKSTLQKCFDRNPDGAGYAVVGGKSKKGFFNFKSLWEKVNSLQNEELIVHCRIATSGPINGEFCHPFSIGNALLFHNGSVKGLGNKDVSDTARVALILKQKEANRNQILAHLSAKTKSRFCIVSKERIQKFGHWYEKDGLSFSNLRWLKPPKADIWAPIPKRRPSKKCWNCNDKILPYKWFCSNCGVLLKEVR